MTEHVWVLSVTHRHGTDISVFKTEAGAIADLTSYVFGNWDDLAQWNGVVDMPSDNWRAIETYFDGVGDEYYELEHVDVQP